MHPDNNRNYHHHKFVLWFIVTLLIIACLTRSQFQSTMLKGPLGVISRYVNNRRAPDLDGIRDHGEFTSIFFFIFLDCRPSSPTYTAIKGTMSDSSDGQLKHPPPPPTPPPHHPHPVFPQWLCRQTVQRNEDKVSSLQRGNKKPYRHKVALWCGTYSLSLNINKTKKFKMSRNAEQL